MSDTSNTGTQLRGFDLVLALPQYYINFKSSKLLHNGKTSDGKIIEKVSLGTDGTPFLTGTVLFQVTFSEGSCTYWDIMSMPPKGPYTASIANTTLSFEVDLARADIAMVDLPTNVKADVDKATRTLAPGTFTIQRLFMDFQSAALDRYDEATTVWPSKFPSEAKKAIPRYIKTYLELLKTATGHVLGYDVTMKNPGNKADPTPTFPPTSLKYDVNQYRPNMNANPGPTEWKPDLDCLTYDMMTGKSKPPYLEPWPWMGNFVQPTPGSTAPTYHATMLISHKQIMQDWLAPALNKTLISYWILSNNNTIDPKATVLYGTLTHDPSTKTLSFTAPPASATSRQSHAFSNDEVTYAMSVHVSVTQNIGPSNPSITITKRTEWDINYTHWYGVPDHAIYDHIHTWFACTYTATITFLGVTDGRIHINVAESSKPAKNPNVTYGDPYGWLVVENEGQPDGWQGILGTLDAACSGAGEVAVPVAVPEKLKGELEGEVGAFVLPGGAQMFFGTWG